MANSRRIVSIAFLTLGFVLVIAGGLCAFYVVPALDASVRAPGGVLAIAAVLAGLMLIAAGSRKLEASPGAADEPHIPGLDAEIEDAPRRRTAA